MVEARWKGETIAKSDRTVVVEDNHYFPPDDVDRDKLVASEHRTTCAWKGEASYYHLEVDGELNENAAWYYPEPSDEAAEIQDHVAFWNGVEVTV